MQKSHISTMLFTHASEYLGYQWIKLITTVTMQLSVNLPYIISIKRWMWPSAVGTQLQNLVRTVPSPHPLRSGVSCFNQPLPQLDHILDWFWVVGTYAPASRPRRSNPQDLGQDCWRARCQDWRNNLTYIAEIWLFRISQGTAATVHTWGNFITFWR